MKKSLKQLQINSATWEDLAQDRPAWRLSVKTGSAIYEANRITAAKARRRSVKTGSAIYETNRIAAAKAKRRFQRLVQQSMRPTGSPPPRPKEYVGGFDGLTLEEKEEEEEEKKEEEEDE
ncbi:unnamed protein product [Schistocephalus solidus]|uniref:Uncharacterized protein n=1 Tax=Schistocephalus solidus TaxID=70667 RepID=A0A3P7BSJ5_SCHSO|nr:unnamed protein product [Schistocephalus solidus]